MSEIQEETYTQLCKENERLKILLMACVGIFEHGVPVTQEFIDDLRKAAQ